MSLWLDGCESGLVDDQCVYVQARPAEVFRRVLLLLSRRIVEAMNDMLWRLVEVHRPRHYRYSLCHHAVEAQASSLLLLIHSRCLLLNSFLTLRHRQW
jgi:hypothetical protein